MRAVGLSAVGEPGALSGLVLFRICLTEPQLPGKGRHQEAPHVQCLPVSVVEILSPDRFLVSGVMSPG